MNFVFIELVSGNGYITTDVLREILWELEPELSDDDLDMMIDEIDSDGSGTVDFAGKHDRCFISHRYYDLQAFSHNLLFNLPILLLQNSWKS